jgi:Fic family protein
MILNHKSAIEFLVESVEELEFDRTMILNLHALLSENLLADPSSGGRLRHELVGISGSVFEPLQNPHRIEECFEDLLKKAAAIEDPFEQAFFFLVQLPYLQPFIDVNKRVSRLGSNIPFICQNLCPLSFIDVTSTQYAHAMLAIYELNDISLLRDLFSWAYRRSAARYRAIRQSLGEPDPFRLARRREIKDLVGQIIREKMSRREAAEAIERRAESLPEDESSRFIEVVEEELETLHEGNFARYRVRPSEFRAWKVRWD